MSLLTHPEHSPSPESLASTSQVNESMTSKREKSRRVRDFLSPNKLKDNLNISVQKAAILLFPGSVNVFHAVYASLSFYTEQNHCGNRYKPAVSVPPVAASSVGFSLSHSRYCTLLY